LQGLRPQTSGVHSFMLVYLCIYLCEINFKFSQWDVV
jgi:hypothetical protein